MIIVNNGVFQNLDKVETGDILIYSSVNNTSFGISFITKSLYTHVGIAVWVDMNVNLKIDNNISIDHSKNNIRKKLMIFETDGGKSLYDYINLKNISNNVRLVSVEDNLENVNKIYLRKLNIKKDADFYKKLENFIYKYKDIPYESDHITILSMMMGINNRKKNKELKSAICTELVYTYLTEVVNLQIEKKYSYPKYYSTRHGKKDINDFLTDQITIYKATYDSYVLALFVLFFILLIISIIYRSYLMYKFYKN